MTRRLWAALILVAGASLAWGEMSKENLNAARSHYQEAVNRHGRNSPEAKNARQNLRSSRHAFHAERRQRRMNRQNPH